MELFKSGGQFALGRGMYEMYNLWRLHRSTSSRKPASLRREVFSTLLSRHSERFVTAFVTKYWREHENGIGADLLSAERLI